MAKRLRRPRPARWLVPLGGAAAAGTVVALMLAAPDSTRPTAPATSAGPLATSDTGDPSAQAQAQPESAPTRVPHRSIASSAERRLDRQVPRDLARHARSNGQVWSFGMPGPQWTRSVPENVHHSLRRRLEPLRFVDAGYGTISIDRRWLQRNLVSRRVPLLGPVRCHRVMIEPLTDALRAVVRDGLARKIHRHDFGGCFNPRYMRGSTDALSMHAFGLAVDVNVQTNLQGAEPQIDPRIVRIFARRGFGWGGNFRVPDGMHFELVAIDPARADGLPPR